MFFSNYLRFHIWKGHDSRSKASPDIILRPFDVEWSELTSATTVGAIHGFNKTIKSQRKLEKHNSFKIFEPRRDIPKSGKTRIFNFCYCRRCRGVPAERLQKAVQAAQDPSMVAAAAKIVTLRQYYIFMIISKLPSISKLLQNAVNRSIDQLT